MLLKLLVVVGIPINCQILEKSRSVWVEQGLVRGSIYNIDGRHIQIFRGIPYAEPPIGDLRFRKPIKKSRWHQELSAIEYGPPCLQFMEFHKSDKFARTNMQRESEDCLYLNVFSPYDIDDESKTYPILVWIHGGSFLAGSADTGIDMEVVAKNIVSRGISFVTINYRLGPLGFMNYKSGEKMDGNYGIWDMVMALQWIQSNMKQFNGDPNRVTVIGESAGGAAASLLAMSPRTQGLVHQAIVMSGSSLAGWAIHRHSQPSYSVNNIVPYLNCDKRVNDYVRTEVIGEQYKNKQSFCNYQDTKVECLTADMTQLQKVDCLRKELNFSSSYFRRAIAAELGVSKMVVDGDLVPTSGVSLAEQYARVPILTGIAQKEWAHKKPLFYNIHQKESLTRSEVEDQVERIIENSFHDTSPEKLSNSTLQLIANATLFRYFETRKPVYPSEKVVSSLQKLESDIEFVAPCHREATSYAKKGIPTFVYSFDYVPEGRITETEQKVFSLFGDAPIEIFKTEKDESELMSAFHGLDHAYIFAKGYSSNFEISPYTKKDEALSKIITTMITNFVKTGDPSLQKFNWPPYTYNVTQYVSINIPLKVINDDIHFPDPQFWNTEAELITGYISKDADVAVDPDADLTNEERVQLSAYRRSWYALWVLVIILSVLIWSFVAYCTYMKSRGGRNKPYDNILLPN